MRVGRSLLAKRLDRQVVCRILWNLGLGLGRRLSATSPL